MIPREIERKFVISVLPTDLVEKTPQLVQQGYLAIERDGAEVRIRRHNNVFSLTVKHGVGLVRDEVETNLTREQFDTLWPLTCGRRIEKSRFSLEWQGSIMVIDVFAGKLTGLMMAETEFKTVEESRLFVPPPWCQREVTDDRRFKNSSLVTGGIPSDD